MVESSAILNAINMIVLPCNFVRMIDAVMMELQGIQHIIRAKAAGEQDMVVIGAGNDIAITPTVHLGFSYDAHLGKNSSDKSIKEMLSIAFQVIRVGIYAA